MVFFFHRTLESIEYTVLTHKEFMGKTKRVFFISLSPRSLWLSVLLKETSVRTGIRTHTLLIKNQSLNPALLKAVDTIGNNTQNNF